MKTKDVYFAAVLIVMGYPLHGVDRTDPRHQEFEFKIDEKAFTDLQLEYMSEKLHVSAWKFKEAIQKMKSVIHSF